MDLGPHTMRSARRWRRALDHSISRRLRRLKIRCGLFTALGHHVEVELLPFDQRRQASPFDRADVHEYVTRAVVGLDESKAPLVIEEFHSTCGHHGLLALYAL